MKINKIDLSKLQTELELNNVVTKFDLKRESYIFEGKEYFKYFVKQGFGAKEATVNFKPNLNKVSSGDGKGYKSDKASYELLDALYGDRKMVDMYVSKEAMTNADTGEVIDYYKYTAVVSDEFGDRWLDVAPERRSDKSVMATFIIDNLRLEKLAIDEAKKPKK